MGDSCERGGSSGGTTTRLLRTAAEDGGYSERKSERPREPWKGEYVKSTVFAGLDAIITCFSLISSISASTSSSVGVLVLGFSNLVADAISMGFGDFVSASSEQDVITEERRVTEWDVMNQRDKEQRELVKHYQALGMDNNDATMVVSIFTKYNGILVDQRMVADKGMLPADQEVKPWKNGLVTFASFMLFGSTPLLSFIILIPFTDSDTVKFVSACLVSALALALLGWQRQGLLVKTLCSLLL
ncbi:Vacuolar iron transporter 1 [Spatholobus suberectus]|nr:Vacuolar iron transporter 1 [Spatholobus suberectus]